MECIVGRFHHAHACAADQELTLHIAADGLITDFLFGRIYSGSVNLHGSDVVAIQRRQVIL